MASALEKMTKHLAELVEALDEGDVADVQQKVEAFINSVDDAWKL